MAPCWFDVISPADDALDAILFGPLLLDLPSARNCCKNVAPFFLRPPAEEEDDDDVILLPLTTCCCKPCRL
jgi:hypothetical protein